MRIAHTADIHIRGLSRHAEYRDVLERFCADVAASNVDALVIAGDIFHSKISGITPEYVELLTWFTRELSRRVKLTLMTLGNHDGNLSNQARSDAVSPIINAVSLPNVICCKESRAYQITPSALLHVFSLFDRDGWEKLQPVADKFNIACFHGPVAGAVSDAGWSVSETDTSLDTFSAFDALFLGDIHKFQIFSRHDAPWGAYPGSLIQQNFGEDDDKGYAVWTLDASKRAKNAVEFRRIPNQHKFVTLSASDARALTPDPLARYRVFGSKRDTVTAEIAASEMRARGATDVVVRYADDAPLSSASYDADSLSPADLLSVAEAMGFDIGHKAEALLALETAMRDVRARSPERKKWSLRAVSFDNVLSYGLGNSVSFEDKRGIIGLFGPNGVGKSSLVGAISYVLFNEIDRPRAKQASIVNKMSDYCVGRGVLDVDGVTYAIERQTVKTLRRDGGDASQTQLNVFRITSDETVDACGEQRSDTEKLLRSLIGDPDECKSTSIATQGSLTKFIDDGPAPRRQALSRALGLAWLDDVHKLLSERALLKRAELRTLTGTDYGFEIGKCSDALLKHEDAIKQLLRERERLSAEKLQAESKRAESFAKTAMIERVSRLQREIVELERDVQAVSPCRHKSEIVADIDAEMHAAERREVIAAHERSVSRIKSNVDRARKLMTVLRDVPCGGAYASCQFIKEAAAAASTISAEEERLRELISAAPAPLAPAPRLSMRELRAELNESERADAVIARREASAARLAAAREDLAQSPAVLDDRAATALAVKKTDDALLSVDAHLFEAKKAADAMKIKLLRLSSDKKRFDELTAASRDAETLAAAFSKKGVPLAVMRSKIDAVNAKLAELLEAAGTLTARATLNEDDLEIEIADGQSWIPVELACGMQRFFVALAFRMVMAKMSPRSPDFFIIDEGFGVLEESNLEAACKLLQHAKSLFSFVLIVSHVDYVKDVADHLIEVTLDADKRSRVGRAA